MPPKKNKRDVTDEMSKDDFERARSEENEEDPGNRDEPLKPREGRVVRGLPKRKGMDAATPSAPPSAPSSSFTFGATGNGTLSSTAPVTAPASASSSGAFSGFSFGKPATSSPSFGSTSASTSTPALESAAAPPKAGAFSNFSFGKPAATPAAGAPKAPTTGFSFGMASAPAAVSSGASVSSDAPAGSGFSGFGTSSSTTLQPASTATKITAPAADRASSSKASFSSASATTERSPSGAGPSRATPPDEGEVAYYTSLRGLNTNFLSSLSQAINGNPFTDLTTVMPSLLSQYSTYLREAESKAGWKPEKVTEEPKVNGDTTATAASKPAPPTSTFSFSKVPTPSATAAPSEATSSTQASNSFTPKRKAADAVNQLINDALDKDESTSEPPAKKAATPVSSSASTAKGGSGLFSFAPSGPLHPTTPDAKTFAPSTTTPVADPPSKLGKFGPDGSAPTLAFGGASGSTPAKSFSFGSSTPSSSTAGFSFGTSSSSGGFSMGVAPPSANTGAPFGAPKESAEKPAASPFSFGAAKPADASASKSGFSFGSSAAPSAPAFSFNASSVKPTFGGFSTAPAAPAPAAEESGTEEVVEPSKNLAETAGAGEEDEDTVVEQRGRLLEFVDGNNKTLGVGQFKLKRSTEGKYRLLMRTDGNGNILLNMAVNTSFAPSLRNAGLISFAGVDLGGSPKPYTLQVKKEAAQGLLDALKAEVAKMS